MLERNRGAPRESWAYASADPPIQPYQYLPIFDVLAFTDTKEPESFTVGFSLAGIVDGLTLSKVQANGDAFL